jgi:tetratricopeptide (TPR) repeat protein
MNTSRGMISITALGWLLVFVAAPSPGQSVRSLVNGGNDLYKEKKFADAEVDYRKALEKDKSLLPGHYDLGNSLHKQGKYDEAMKEYENALEKQADKTLRSSAYYNIGNSLMKEQKYEDAVKAYIESLKLNPDDAEAKYNLSYALEKLRQQQQQQKQNKDNKQNDKNKQNQDKNKQQNQQNQQDKQDQKKPEKQQQPQASQQEKKMSKADAERILDVLKNSEKDIQRKLRVRQAVRPRTDKDW